jgi:asparagine synthase (glutamine-hydrolysing)
VTVLLSGTGGDELFGGYRRHRLKHLLARLAWLPRSLAAAAVHWLADREQNRRTPGGERMLMIRKLLEARARPSFFDAYLSTIEPASPRLWSESLATGVDPAGVGAALYADLVAELGREPASSEEAAFAADHLYYLPDDLLLKEDRMTMGASVEGRVPFLDVALVEFAAALPLETRFDGLQGKRLLRRIARRHLPSHIVDRPKHGFSVPVVEWLRGPLRELAGDVFAGQGSGMFRMAELRRWNDLHRLGTDRSGPLWAALCFELWWTEVGSTSTGVRSVAGMGSIA